MNLLLDTNALIWWLEDNSRIAGRPRATIADPGNTVYVSAVTTWELAIKVGIGRLRVRTDLTDWLPRELDAQRFTPLPITLAHTLRVESLPRHHGDPFDRLLIAQALTEGYWLVTGDPVFAEYGVPVIPC